MAARSSLVARCARPLDRPSVGVAASARRSQGVAREEQSCKFVCAKRGLGFCDAVGIFFGSYCTRYNESESVRCQLSVCKHTHDLHTYRESR